MSETLTRTVTKTDIQTGDHDRFAHYVRKDKVTDARVFGVPVEALCGKIWIPSRDPNNYPVCPECKDIYESIGT